MVRIPFRALRRSRYLHHTAQDTNAPAVTFVAAWAKGANVLLKAGLVP
jgi:hypothetical protein